MKITVLAENTTASPDIIAEHGLSLYIETDNRKMLFDMGQTDVFAINASTLGIDLSQVEFAVLSHGHYDHGGGLSKFLSINRTAPVYLSKHAFGNHFSTKYIGLDKGLKSQRQLHFVSDYLKLDTNIELFSCNDVKLKYPLQPFGLTADIDGVRRDEDFRHEQYMLINENGRKVLISGCSHKGIINLVDCFKPDVVIGGFHYMKQITEGEGRAALDEAANALNKSDTVYYTCHCTGEAQYKYLKTKMENLHYISCGTCIEI